MFCGLAEIKLRAVVPAETVVVAPSLCRVYSRGKIEVDKLTELEADWMAKIKFAKHAFFVVHADAPSHFTCLEIHEILSPESPSLTSWRVEYRDSLRDSPASSRGAAKAILVNLGIVGPTFELPRATNKTYQADGWSCGILGE